MIVKLSRGRRRAPPPALNIPPCQDLLSKCSTPASPRTRIPTPARILTPTPTSTRSILNQPLNPFTPFESVPTAVLPARKSTILAHTLAPTSKSQSVSSTGTQSPTVTVFVTPSASISVITVTRPSASVDEDRVETPTATTVPMSLQAPVQQSSNPSTEPQLASGLPGRAISGSGVALLAVLGIIAGLSVLGTLAFIIFRRRKRRAEAAVQEKNMAVAGFGDGEDSFRALRGGRPIGILRSQDS